MEAGLSAIRLENVVKMWGATRAVNSVNLDVQAGSMVVLLGPSGCGKSTTLRLIAGLENVSSGRIWIQGEEVTNLPPSRRRLSMVFQSYALFPHMSVRENILFGLRVRKISQHEQKKRLEKAVDLLGLGSLLERKPAALSGGQQQRVALGRALVAEAAVCLMDEPLSNLDAKLRQEMRREIRNLQQSLGMTMIYVTHDQVEAMSMADSIVLMENGHIVQEARPQVLYDAPLTSFAASFIGTPPMNLVQLENMDGCCFIASSPQSEMPFLVPSGTILGMRPEHIQLAHTFSEHAWPAFVHSVEYLGAISIVCCTVGNQQLAVQNTKDIECRAGDKVYINCHTQHMHCFDATTKNRIAVTRM